MLGRWADVMLIAPLSCNTLAKMANGLCDNFLLAVYLSATCPVIVAPAMDEDMWHHPSTKKNLKRLDSWKCRLFLLKMENWQVVYMEKEEWQNLKRSLNILKIFFKKKIIEQVKKHWLLQAHI